MRRGSLAFGALGVGAIIAGGAHALPIRGPTGHYYEFFATPLGWSEALATAASQSYLGHPGHLVTITSDAENQFVEALLPDGTFWLWLAASDEEIEGTWKWVAGPEAGEVFWQDGTTLTYANWAIGEPNDLMNEDYAQMYEGLGNWNDILGPLNADALPYVVEYVVPEPGTGLLVMTGLFGLATRRRRRA